MGGLVDVGPYLLEHFTKPLDTLWIHESDPRIARLRQQNNTCSIWQVTHLLEHQQQHRRTQLMLCLSLWDFECSQKLCNPNNWPCQLGTIVENSICIGQTGNWHSYRYLAKRLKSRNAYIIYTISGYCDIHCAHLSQQPSRKSCMRLKPPKFKIHNLHAHAEHDVLAYKLRILQQETPWHLSARLFFETWPKQKQSESKFVNHLGTCPTIPSSRQAYDLESIPIDTITKGVWMTCCLLILWYLKHSWEINYKRAWQWGRRAAWVVMKSSKWLRD